MASAALRRWRTDRSAALDEIETINRAIGGTGPRKPATRQQLTQAYALLLSSEFQCFCRDLHTECVRAVARVFPSPGLQNLITEGLSLGRKLDAGNPNPGNIGADFKRFSLSFWPVVNAAHTRNVRRKASLEQMNRWRNAIAHNDFDPSMLRGGRPLLSLAEVRRWRMACDGLARWFDRLMHNQLRAILGTNPW
jgi:hypothetical protein